MSLRRRSLTLAAPLLGLALLATACGGDSDSDDSEEVSGDGATASAEAAVLHTSEGDIEVTLFPEETPETVGNFAGLADGSKEWSGQEGDEPLYQDVIFHRVIDGFMIQGGSPDGTGGGGPGYQFEDEITDRTFDRPYLLAMANSGADTNGSQFFITVQETRHLDGLHTIFGEVTDPESQEVVDAIAGTETSQPGDQPVEDIVLESVTLS